MTNAGRAGPRARAGRGDILVGAVLVLAGAVLWFHAIPVYVEEPAGVSPPLSSPQVLPRAMAATLAMLGVLIALQDLRGRAPDVHVAAGGSSPRGLAIVLGAIAFYLGLVGILGAMATAVIATSALLLVEGERRWPVILLGGGLVPVLAVLLLETLGNVPLPRGILLDP